MGRRKIRTKFLWIALVLLSVQVALGGAALRGIYAYRDLATIVSARAAEIPFAGRLTRAVDQLRLATRHPAAPAHQVVVFGFSPHADARRHFEVQLGLVRETLGDYRARLDEELDSHNRLGDRSEEMETVAQIAEALRRIDTTWRSAAHWGDAELFRAIEDDLEQLSNQAHLLPTYLQKRMVRFRDEVRVQYRTWIAVTTLAAGFSLVLVVGAALYFRRGVVHPFKELLAGARRVASGDFTHRIELAGQDELSRTDELGELAIAINRATQSFLDIQQDLHDQVRERSREVIRNEQLASVGFLAAGVAHEINNPLASICWSAEALESRLHRLLHDVPAASAETSAERVAEPMVSPDLDVLRTYLRRIQDEAFRCKGITERLLDFSRLGTAEKKQVADLSALAADVVDMVRHLGQYRDRRIELLAPPNLHGWASPPEMKQVILNLLTNALDSIPDDQADGKVTVRLNQQAEYVRIVVQDNGCGMATEVLEHIFEPFFTQRRDGRGTGLGLPICSRIVADHAGHIVAHSPGVNQGARFEVLIPRPPQSAVAHESRTQAA